MSWDSVKRLSVETAVFVVFLFLFFMVTMSPAEADTAVVVAACGTPPATYAAGQNRPQTQDENGVLCDGGGTGTAAQEVQGNVASGATDSGNPVKVGGVYNSTPPTLTNGQRGDLQLTAKGSAQASLVRADTGAAFDGASPSDNYPANTSALGIKAAGLNFNGTSWDRTRNNTDITVLSSAARTATTASSDITNYNGRGLHLVIDVTAVADTPSMVCTIQGKDTLSSAYYTILASAAITGVSTNVYRVFPGSTVMANAAANDIIPRTWRVNCVNDDSNSITYSIGASVVL
jgi:hypothetical protein